MSWNLQIATPVSLRPWLDLPGQSNAARCLAGCRCKCGTTFTWLDYKLQKAFLATGKMKGLFLMNEGRSLIPAFTNASSCQREPCIKVGRLSGLPLAQRCTGCSPNCCTPPRTEQWSRPPSHLGSLSTVNVPPSGWLCGAVGPADSRAIAIRC